MDDLIDRQAAIDALERKKDKTAKGEIGSFYNTIIQHDIDAIVELPSVQPERKTGKWSVEFSPAYKGGAYCECSQCNYKFAMGAYFEPDEWKFCPYCGADMRGEQDGSDRQTGGD